MFPCHTISCFSSSARTHAHQTQRYEHLYILPSSWLQPILEISLARSLSLSPTLARRAMRLFFDSFVCCIRDYVVYVRVCVYISLCVCVCVRPSLQWRWLLWNFVHFIHAFSRCSCSSSTLCCYCCWWCIGANESVRPRIPYTYIHISYIQMRWGSQQDQEEKEIEWAIVEEMLRYFMLHVLCLPLICIYLLYSFAFCFVHLNAFFSLQTPNDKYIL